MAQPRSTVPASVASPAWGALFDAVSDLIAFVAADGQLLWVNAAFARASGHGRHGAIGQPVQQALQLGDAVGEALAAGLDLSAQPVSWVAADGSARSGD